MHKDKKNCNMQIIFFGTPTIAAYTLEQLLKKSKHQIVAVVTKPDRAAGRGMKINPSEVKRIALANNIDVLQPNDLNDPAFIEKLKSYKADLFLVYAFRYLPHEVWTIPPKGTINLHASLLPNYRGAAPINWAIINGETKTGMTIFFINDKIDTGNILIQQEVDIDPEDTALTLQEKIMKLSPDFIEQALDIIAKGKFKLIDQNELIDQNKELKLAPKIMKNMAKIDWSKDPVEINNLVRGMYPKPIAWSRIQKKDGKVILVKIVKGMPVYAKHEYEYGKIIVDDKKRMKVACKNGLYEITQLIPENKKQMYTNEFLNGYKIDDGIFY